MMCHEKSFFNTSPQSLFPSLVLVLPVGGDATCLLCERLELDLVLRLLLLQCLLLLVLLLLAALLVLQRLLVQHLLGL